MTFGTYIRRLTPAWGESNLDEQEAYQLFSALLDGGIPDLELGAIALSLAIWPVALTQLIGFQRASAQRVTRLYSPRNGLKPVLLPAYGGAREQPNLLPLLALLLTRFNVPVLLHGTLDGGERIAAAYVLRELGIMPCANAQQAQSALEDSLLAFVPVGVLCPGLAAMLALGGRLGVPSGIHTLVAKLLDPFDGRALKLAAAEADSDLDRLREFFRATGFDAIVLRTADGEPVADPRRRPRIEYCTQGRCSVLFEEDLGTVETAARLPSGADAQATAHWIRSALAGEEALPQPLVNQLACCLYAAGYTSDMNQAKAIAAVETGSLGRARGDRPGKPPLTTVLLSE
jgi:anthranilate phosphoribosyltransferase